MSLVVHDIICGSSCPRGAGLQDLFPSRVMSHCLLVETDEGLVLVDTGVGSILAADPAAQLGTVKSFFFGVDHPKSTFVSARERVEALGHRVNDVRHIIPTHLDFDHCGDLADFPHAKVHAFEQELNRALAPQTSMDKKRYLETPLKHGPSWSLYNGTEGEPWFGFETVRALVGLPPELLLVPLFGHTVGHTGVVVKAEEGWVLHAGDAYYQRKHLFEPMSMASRWVRRQIDDNPSNAQHNQQRLAKLIESESSVRVFCSHDPTECTGH
jgi:glyoxylase-like metal-dependent hydrolase (beta-lactamase superfamily II)